MKYLKNIQVQIRHRHRMSSNWSKNTESRALSHDTLRTAISYLVLTAAIVLDM